MADSWDPQQYARFSAERSAPFRDLLDLLHPVERPSLVDLGCGSGELTALAHERTGARASLGVDASPAMLERAAAQVRPGLRFLRADVSTFVPPDPVDIVISNAALHWLDDHVEVIGRYARLLPAGGQLAVQMPANSDHPSHLVAREVAAEEPYAGAMAGGAPPDPAARVEAPERYARLLFDLGFSEQHTRLQVYGHVLASSSDVVEWVKGTSLTRFQASLPPELFASFLERYRVRLLERIGDVSPYFYAFKRILFWGRMSP